MKKLFAVLFCTWVMTGYSFADALSYEIDPVVTAEAPWKIGEKIVKAGDCHGEKFNREFLGMTQSILALVQDFYLSGEKLSDPFLMMVKDAGQNTGGLCRKDMEGVYTEWYKSGRKRVELNFKNGKKEGRGTAWYENGQKNSEVDLKNDKFDGFVTAWYDNGQKMGVAHYTNDKREGLQTEWYKNGQKKSECDFKNDNKFGMCRKWDEKGNLIEEKEFSPKKD